MKNTKLASIINISLTDKIEDEKLLKLIRAFYMLKKLSKSVNSKFNNEIWKNDLKGARWRSNAIVLQKKHILIAKAGCAMADAWDKIMGMKLDLD